MSCRIDSESGALEVARRAVLTDRVWVAPEADEYPAADLDHAMRTATNAEAIYPPEYWRLRGGTDRDGDPLTVEIEVREQVVRITRATTET